MAERGMMFVKIEGKAESSNALGQDARWRRNGTRQGRGEEGKREGARRGEGLGGE